MDVGARPRYDVKVAPGAALLSFLAALKEAAPALFPFSESADTTSGRCLAVEGLHGELLCIGSQVGCGCCAAAPAGLCYQLTVCLDNVDVVGFRYGAHQLCPR